MNARADLYPDLTHSIHDVERALEGPFDQAGLAGLQDGQLPPTDTPTSGRGSSAIPGSPWIPGHLTSCPDPR
jgi:hypothetical protein